LLKASGFSSFGGIDTSVRILARTTNSDWYLDGIHVNATGDTCFRNNLTGGISSSGTEFGLGKNLRNHNFPAGQSSADL
jgi:hypothetical protein